MTRPTPIELRRLRGNPGKRRIPDVVHSPRPSAVPGPPDWLKGWGRETWVQLAPEAHAMGVLTSADLPAFGILCRTVGHWHDCEELAEAALADDPAQGRLAQDGCAIRP